MLQKEFEERIGRSVSEQEYVEANAVYEAAGDMNKDEFCREWVKIGSSRLVECLAAAAYNLGKELREYELMLGECRGMISDAADAMLEIADGILGGETAEHTSREEVTAVLLTRKAWWLVGQKEVTRRRVKNGYRLDDRDRETIGAALEARTTDERGLDHSAALAARTMDER